MKTMVRFAARALQGREVFPGVLTTQKRFVMGLSMNILRRPE